MELTEKLLSELQRRLKIGNGRGVHLNAIPANSRYKFDLNRLSNIDKWRITLAHNRFGNWLNLTENIL